MITINEIFLNEKKYFARQPDELKNANKEALKYIQTIASTSQTNISHWDIGTIFKDPTNKKTSLDLIKDKKLLNKLFFETKMVEDSNPTTVDTNILNLIRTNLKKIDNSIINERKNTLNRVISSEEQRITEYQNEISRRIAAIIRNRKELLSLDGIDSNEKVLSEIAEILKSNFYKFESFDRNVLTLSTKNDVINTYKNTAANIDCTVNLGKFKILLDVQNASVMVLPKENNVIYEKDSNKWYHPHIRYSGAICWGNANSAVTGLLSGLEFKKVLDILSSILLNFNFENPYVQLTRFEMQVKVNSGEYEWTNSYKDIIQPIKKTKHETRSQEVPF